MQSSNEKHKHVERLQIYILYTAGKEQAVKLTLQFNKALKFNKALQFNEAL